MICISIQEKNIEKCLGIIESSEMAEIRIDIAGFDESEVRLIFSTSNKPLIATCRPGEVNDPTRLKLLKAAIDAGADYIDVEIDADENVRTDLIEHAKSNNCKVIVSYHNYVNTPGSEELHSIFNTCINAGADIVKIATTAIAISDCARILSLYEFYELYKHEHSSAKELVALAMGETGKITRVANLYLGSPFTFAAFSEDQKTAAGQLTASEINFIKTIINKA